MEVSCHLHMKKMLNSPIFDLCNRFLVVAIERGIKDSTIVSEIKKGWAQEKESVFVFRLVRLEHEAVVNFNTYFRMMAGVSETRTKFPISSATSVGELNDTVWELDQSPALLREILTFFLFFFVFSRSRPTSSSPLPRFALVSLAITEMAKVGDYFFFWHNSSLRNDG